MSNDPRPPTPSEVRELDAVIIGAGLSGMYALHRLRQLGLRLRAYDEAADVGGTWWWNRYPGARVDSPGAPFYAYTFSEELARGWDWTETQPDQPSILSYLRHVADRFDLRRDIQLGTRVCQARFDEEAGRWLLRTSQGERISAQFLISAVGTLSESYLPNIPGLDHFEGETYHTGHWPQERVVTFAGKRVGVIGTGSSGVQIIPMIARDAAHLTVFQRTPQYVLPGRNRSLDPVLAEESKRDWARFRRMIVDTGRPFPQATVRALDDTPEQRRAKYEAAWQNGGMAVRAAYRDHLTDKAANFEVSEFVRSKIREIVRDPEVAGRLLPDYYFGTKRLILGEGYYETYNRDNVTLVDLREQPIVEISADAVRTTGSTHQLDMLVLATGYDALTGALRRLNPTGRGGITIEQKWAEGVRAYLGLGVAGFPNLLMIHGPQTPSVKFHMPLGAELQGDWIAECIGYMRERGLTTVEPTAGVEEDWGEEVRRIADDTLYPLTDSWFTGANIPGKPREFMIHLDGPGYHRRIREVAASGYRGFAFDRGPR